MSREIHTEFGGGFDWYGLYARAKDYKDKSGNYKTDYLCFYKDNFKEGDLIKIKRTLNHFTGTNIRRVNIMTFSELELVIDTIIDYINYAYILNHNDYKCLARLLLKELDETQKKSISDKLDSVYSEKEQQRKQIKEEMGV